MRTAIATLFLTPASTPDTQLPPEIEFERLLLRLVEEVVKDDTSGTHLAWHKIETFSEEHGLEILQKYS